MLNNHFKIHPRGFYGSGEAGIMLRVVPPNQMVTKPLEQGTTESFVANKAVDEIFHAYVAKEYSVADFDWACKVVSTILSAFGTNNLAVWHVTQYSSPFFGQMHVDFLEDCFKYASTGLRTMDLYTWAAILDRDNHSADIKKELCSFTARYLGKKTVHPFSTEQRYVSEFIADTLSQPNGFDNLVLMAQILFCIKR